MKHSSVFRFLISFTLFTAGSGLYAQPCPQGNINFKSQIQLDSFKLLFPKCKEIQGNVRIYSELDTIKDLSLLSEIITIGGYLSIYQNPGLEDLSGLENLTTIHGYLAISNNASLNNLTALNQITSINGTLDIHDNPRLQDLSGLDNIHLELHDRLAITNNALLNSCSISSVCQHLKHYGRFEIYGNGTDCEYFENVYQNCMYPADSLEHFEESCIEDGFENWQVEEDTLLPKGWSYFPEFRFTMGIPNIERVNGLNEGDYSLLIRSNRMGFEGPVKQSIWMDICDLPPQVDISFTYTCKGLGFCDMYLYESVDTTGGIYRRQIWNGQSTDTFKRTVVLNNIPVHPSRRGFFRIAFQTHPMYEDNGTWGGTEFTIDSLIIRSQHHIVSAVAQPNSRPKPVVYPNPSTGPIFIQLNSSELPKKVNLFDSSGRLLRTENFSTHLDLIDYPQGIYFIKIQLDKFTTIHKIVKI